LTCGRSRVERRCSGLLHYRGRLSSVRRRVPSSSKMTCQCHTLVVERPEGPLHQTVGRYSTWPVPRRLWQRRYRRRIPPIFFPPTSPFDSPSRLPPNGQRRRRSGPVDQGGPRPVHEVREVHLGFTTPTLLTRRRRKQAGQYFDPCHEAAERTYRCLTRNEGDREMCRDYFE
jgi:hypothetical protein